MALEELTVESPEYFDNESGNGETRYFLTTDLADVPARGDTANAAFFPSGYKVNSASYRPAGFEGASQRYRVSVAAVPLDRYNPGPDDYDDTELPLNEGWDVVIEEEPIIKDGVVTLDNAGNLQKFRIARVIYTIEKRYDADKKTELREDTLEKVGKVNDSANDPFVGAVVGQWQCTGAPTAKESDGQWRTTWQYEHAGYTATGTVLTWQDKAELVSVIDDTYIEYRTGTIGPLE